MKAFISQLTANISELTTAIFKIPHSICPITGFNSKITGFISQLTSLISQMMSLISQMPNFSCPITCSISQMISNISHIMAVISPLTALIPQIFPVNCALCTLHFALFPSIYGLSIKIPAIVHCALWILHWFAPIVHCLRIVHCAFPPLFTGFLSFWAILRDNSAYVVGAESQTRHRFWVWTM